MRQLIPPDELLRDESRRELLRAWIDAGKLSVSMVETLPGYETKQGQTVWEMLLSDVSHHVIDAIHKETQQPRRDVRLKIKGSLLDTLSDQRGVRFRSIITTQLHPSELGIKNASGDESAVEMVRIFFIDDGVRIIVRVGMWHANGAEENNWANIIYDLAHMVASVIKDERDSIEVVRNKMVKSVLDYLDRPTSKYDGHYY